MDGLRSFLEASETTCPPRHTKHGHTVWRAPCQIRPSGCRALCGLLWDGWWHSLPGDVIDKQGPGCTSVIASGHRPGRMRMTRASNGSSGGSPMEKTSKPRDRDGRCLTRETSERPASGWEELVCLKSCHRKDKRCGCQARTR